MAGTPNQVRATIRETLKERTDVRDVMGEAERSGARGRFNVEAIQQQLTSLTGLGSLDNRVADKVRARLTEVSPTDRGGLANKVNEQRVKELVPADQVNAVIATLKALRQNVSAINIVGALSMLGIKATIDETASDLARKLAQTGVYDQATTENIQTKLSERMDANKNLKIKELYTTDGNNTITATNVDFEPDNAAAVLGITRNQLDEMTLSEAKAMLASYRQRSFADVDELRDLVANPFATQGQKDFARKRLAELGAIGVTSLEEKSGDIQAQMEQGDTVKFGNRQVRVSEIATDATLKALVANALASPEELTKLKATDKELGEWVEKNQAELVDVKKELEQKGLGAFATNNKIIRDYVTQAPTGLLDKMVPNWRDATDAKLDDWKTTLPAPLNNALSETNASAKAVKLAALEAFLPLSATFANTVPSTTLDAIVTGAGGDVGKATELAKDWYQSTLVPAAELTPTFGLKYVPTDSEEKGLFDDLTKRLLERVTGTSQSLSDFSATVKNKLESTKAIERQEGMAMLKQFNQTKSLMNSLLTQSTMIDLKNQKTKAAQYTKDMESKSKEIQATERRTSLTPLPIMTVLKMLPGERDHLMGISGGFMGAFSYIGDHLRQLITGRLPHAFVLWSLNENRDPIPTLDAVILHIADQTRKVGSAYEHYSKASWNSGRLFSLRDELEAQARQDLATRRKEYGTLEAERKYAQSQYNTLYNSIVTGG